MHRLFVMAGREALGRELARFDLDVPQVKIAQERYDRVLRCETQQCRWSHAGETQPVSVSKASRIPWEANRPKIPSIPAQA